MVNKKIVAICTIIAVVVVVLAVAIQIKKFNEIDYTQEASIDNQNMLQEENIIENEVQEENVATLENAIKESETQANIQGVEETQVNEENQESEESTENYSEKALELAKEEWGEDDSVYYTIDNQADNIYNISVRSKETTATLIEYEVNVNTQEVSVK